MKTHIHHFYFIVLLISFYQKNLAQNSYFDDSSKITIKFIGEKKMFPENWYNSQINAAYKTVDSSEIDRSIKCILKAIRKYPKSVLTKNLSEVYVFKELNFYGVNFGATYYEDKIFIANDGKKNGYSDFYIEKGFHHEFSSILYQNYKSLFDESSWVKNTEMKYETGGVNALKSGTASQELDSTLNAKGFLHQYACSSMENDINAFAENIFLPKKNFWKRTEKTTLLKNKRNILIKFYHQINTTFTEEYFKNIENGI